MMPAPWWVDIVFRVLSTDGVMVIVWVVPFVVCMYLRAKRRTFGPLLAALICLPPIIYYSWATTGWWQFHETAVAFNRSADIASAFLLLLLVTGIYGRVR